LADARKALEQARRKALESGVAPPVATQPEYAAATLYVAGSARLLADTLVCGHGDLSLS
jgi:hypothetical protein